MLNNKIILTSYDAQFDPVLMQFFLPEEQAQFTGMPHEMISKAKEDQTRNPVVILNGSHPVGFFVLCSGEVVLDYSSNNNALLLIAFSINHSEQGKGYAKNGLLRLRDYIKVHFSNNNEVVLAVNCKNSPAQKLYEKVGFKDTGKRKMGKNGEQIILSLQL